MRKSFYRVYIQRVSGGNGILLIKAPFGSDEYQSKIPDLLFHQNTPDVKIVDYVETVGYDDFENPQPYETKYDYSGI